MADHIATNKRAGFFNISDGKITNKIINGIVNHLYFTTSASRQADPLTGVTLNPD
jgi:hypothetical protein